MIGGNVFSIMFGRNLDAHAPSEPATNATLSSFSNSALNSTLDSTLPSLLARAEAIPSSDSSHQCLQGRECYAGSLMLTIAACTCALALSVYAAWRDWRSERRRERLLRVPHVHVHAPEVVWDEEE